MKKILLLALSVTLTAGLQAQSLSLSYSGGPIQPGSTIQIMGNPMDDPIQMDIQTTNNTSVPVSVKIRKIINAGDTISGTTNTFCWGVCYPPNIYLSPNALTIDPGATVDEFDGDYTPAGINGISTISYVFFNTADTNDAVKVTVQYNASPTGVAEKLLEKVNFSSAYPNPASKNVNFNYSLPVDFNSANLTISNILGTVVREVKINNISGSLQIPVSELSDGIYFYSLKVNEQLLLTKKMIVRH